MVVQVTAKNEEDTIKNEGPIALTTFNINFSDTQRAAYSEISNGIWPNAKNDEDPIKNEGTRLLTRLG